MSSEREVKSESGAPPAVGSLSGRQCKARRKDGQQCEGFCVGGTDFCLAHARINSAKQCKARRKDGQQCEAIAVGGTDLCIAHARVKKHLTRKIVKAAGPEGAIYPEELEAYNSLIDELRSETKAQGISDDIAIDRLVTAMIRARRLDAMAKGGNMQALRNLFFADRSIMDWLKHLGLDRRARKKGEDDTTRQAKRMKKHGWMLGEGSEGRVGPTGREVPDLKHGDEKEEDEEELQ